MEVDRLSNERQSCGHLFKDCEGETRTLLWQAVGKVSDAEKKAKGVEMGVTGAEVSKTRRGGVSWERSVHRNKT